MAISLSEPVFEDDDFVAFNKPAGLLVIPDGFDKNKDNMRDILRSRYGKIFVVHRLDKDASGAICFAKNEEAHRDLSMKFANRKVRKIYDALVTGILKEKASVIDAPIAQSFKNPERMVIDRRNGKESVTGYKVISEFKGFYSFSLVQAMPETGRTHQIRVHFQHIGHPLAIDKLYGSSRGIFLSDIKRGYRKKEGEAEKPLISRLTLHGRSLVFNHFRKGINISVETEWPKDFTVALKAFHKHA